ncbi:MAG TPA: hypothetical protein VII38_22925 [Polyangia bacterium]
MAARVGTIPELVFTTPRHLPDARKLRGRVAVVDIAFAADGMGTPFQSTTGAFLRELGGRLAAWVDHHDHERHAEFRGDTRFTLATKAEHGACPEMVTPEVVREAGPIDTLVCHVDLDGLYAAAKWILGGREPYPGADDDARAVDTRIGAPGPTGELVDKALRAHFRDEGLKHRIVRWLIDGMKDKALGREIAEAAADFDRMAAEALRLATGFERRGRAVYVDAGAEARIAYDKTLLLLEGQKLAEVAIVRDAGMITIAAAFDSGIDFVKLLGLGGGMPTRVSIAESRLGEVLEKLNA